MVNNILKSSVQKILASVTVAALVTRVANAVAAPSKKNVKVMKVSICQYVYQQRRFQDSVEKQLPGDVL